MKKTLKQWMCFLAKYLAFSLHPPCAPVPEGGRVSDQYTSVQWNVADTGCLLTDSLYVLPHFKNSKCFPERIFHTKDFVVLSS